MKVWFGTFTKKKKKKAVAAFWTQLDLCVTWWHFTAPQTTNTFKCVMSYVLLWSSRSNVSICLFLISLFYLCERVCVCVCVCVIGCRLPPGAMGLKAGSSPVPVGSPLLSKTASTCYFVQTMLIKPKLGQSTVGHSASIFVSVKPLNSLKR